MNSTLAAALNGVASAPSTAIGTSDAHTLHADRPRSRASAYSSTVAAHTTIASGHSHQAGSGEKYGCAGMNSR